MGAVLAGCLRYADTKGYVFNEDRNYPFAHVYRDWVIRSLNEDLPYDQFLMQQLAADRAPQNGEQNSHLPAMGFLTLGRRFLNNKFDIIDDRIDVTMRGMMALTVSCARCHDHKFDPIPTADYYSLFGVFDASVEKLQPVAPASEDYLNGVREREAKIEQFLNDQRPEIEEKARGAMQYWLLAAAVGQEEVAKKNLTSKIFDEAFGNRQNRRFVERWKSYLDEARKEPHPIFAPWFELSAIPEGEFEAKAAEIAERAAKNTGSKVNERVAQQFATPPKTLVEVAARYAELFQKINDEWKQKLDVAKNHNEPAPTALDDPAAEQLRQVLYAANSPVEIPAQETEQYLDRKSRDQFRGLRAELTKWASSPGAPLQAMTMDDARDVSRNPRVLVRGNPGRPGDEVPRQFLSIVAGEKRQPFTQGSGRLDLAHAIASPENPLTGARAGEPCLAASLWPGVGANAKRFWSAERAPQSPGVARLPCGAIHGRWLVDQEAASLDHAVSHLSAVERGAKGRRRKGSRKPAFVADESQADGSGSDARFAFIRRRNA